MPQPRLSASTMLAAHCDLLARRGHCKASTEVHDDMARFCGPDTCSGTAEASMSDAYQSWSRLSLSDFMLRTGSGCHQRIETAWCDASSLEDHARIKDRGWAIRRGLMPPAERDVLLAELAALPEPLRSNCGANSYHPSECTLPPRRLRALAPKFERGLRSMLHEWLTNGLHDEAHLGWPLRVEQSEFIALNTWRRRDATIECVMQALFLASIGTPDESRDNCQRTALARLRAVRASGAAKNGTTSRDARRWHTLSYWLACLQCYWLAVTRLPREDLLRIVSAPQCTRLPASLAFMHRWRFAPAGSNDTLAPNWQRMSTWLTSTLNDSRFFRGSQGFHGWHLDGPAKSGRHHKAWVLLSKNRSAGRSPSADAARSNLAAVPAAAKYAAHDCQLGRAALLGEWEPEELSCRPAMQPGDVIFFREDVWHASADAELERIALIVHIFRLPLRNTPQDVLAPNCEPWCSEPCTTLNGNVRIECGECKAGGSRCHPGAVGFQ